MATKIKLMRLGKMRAPYYRIVVADARTKRDGRVIETIGKYHPKEDPSVIEVDPDRAAYWLGVGAQPTDPVERLLKVTGDWQLFKGEPAPPAKLVAEPKVDRRAVFEAAHREAAEGAAATGAATTPRVKKAPKADSDPAEAAPVDAATADAAPAAAVAPADTHPADAAPVDAPAADAAPADTAPVDAAAPEDVVRAEQD